MVIFSRYLLVFLFLLSTSLFATDHMVTAGGSATVFTPSALTINAGDTVTFVNGGGVHNVVASDGSFSSGEATDSFTFTQAFPNPGTFGFYCSIHGAPNGTGMAGVVTVNAVTTPPPAAAPITGATSGSWYDPDESGHGFLIQVAPSNLFIAYWFVYTPDGTAQAWVDGAGPYDPTSNSVTIEMQQDVGAKFPPLFNHSDLTQTDWGTLTFTQIDCTHATVSWVPKVASYPPSSAPLPLTKIVGVNGLTCTN
jgi:plastocyanin